MACPVHFELNACWVGHSSQVFYGHPPRMGAGGRFGPLRVDSALRETEGEETQEGGDVRGFLITLPYSRLKVQLS